MDGVSVRPGCTRYCPRESYENESQDWPIDRLNAALKARNEVHDVHFPAPIIGKDDNTQPAGTKVKGNFKRGEDSPFYKHGAHVAEVTDAQKARGAAYRAGLKQHHNVKHGRYLGRWRARDLPSQLRREQVAGIQIVLRLGTGRKFGREAHGYVHGRFVGMKPERRERKSVRAAVRAKLLEDGISLRRNFARPEQWKETQAAAQENRPASLMITSVCERVDALSVELLKRILGANVATTAHELVASTKINATRQTAISMFNDAKAAGIITEHDLKSDLYRELKMALLRDTITLYDEDIDYAVKRAKSIDVDIVRATTLWMSAKERTDGSIYRIGRDLLLPPRKEDLQSDQTALHPRSLDHWQFTYLPSIIAKVGTLFSTYSPRVRLAANILLLFARDSGSAAGAKGLDIANKQIRHIVRLRAEWEEDAGGTQPSYVVQRNPEIGQFPSNAGIFDYLARRDRIISHLPLRVRKSTLVMIGAYSYVLGAGMEKGCAGSGAETHVVDFLDILLLSFDEMRAFRLVIAS